MPSKKRSVGKEKKISNVSSDDTRAKLVGTITSKDDDSSLLTLDDGEDQARVVTEELDSVDFEVGDKIRIIGLVRQSLSEEEDFEINAEIIQDASDLDMDIYNKYLDMKIS